MTGPVLAQALGELVRDAVPEWLIPVSLAVTRLGNVAVFLIAFALDYWFVDRDRGAHAVAVIVGGMAFITALKYLFAAPRPPNEVNVYPIAGFSFPSGHAMGATIAYGTLAHDLDVSTRRRRYAFAALLIGLVALSRVVLGVHYVRDVGGGVAFGVAFLALAFAVTGRDPRDGFAFALVVAVLALIVSGASHDAVAVLGFAVGGAAVWEAVDDHPRIDEESTVDERRWQLFLVGIVLPVLAVLGYLTIQGGFPLPGTFVLATAVAAGILGGPVLVDRLKAA